MSRVVHFEIQADDVERAKSFYAAVFDWSFQDYGEFTGSTYWGIVTGPGERAGHQRRPAAAARPGSGRGPGHQRFRLHDGGRRLRRDRAPHPRRRGQVALPKMALTGMAWQGYYLDTEGNTFGIHQPDPEAG